MINFRKIFVIVLVSINIVVICILFGQFLGSYYIYNILSEDNPVSETLSNPAPVEKLKVLRLDSVKFYTLQIGIYSEVKAAQANIDRLVEIGLRPFVSSGPPYKIWVGCFSEKNNGIVLKENLEKKGFEIFIGEGLINDRALKFPSDNNFMAEKFAPLLGEYNLVLNHSLKMFVSPHYSVYKEQVWSEMINKIQEEVNRAISKTDQILQMDESKNYYQELSMLKEKAIIYGQVLDKIRETKRDEAVLLCQGYLLELIDCYHETIEKVTNKVLIN